MQMSGGHLLLPVQTLAATLRFPPRGNGNRLPYPAPPGRAWSHCAPGLFLFPGFLPGNKAASKVLNIYRQERPPCRVVFSYLEVRGRESNPCKCRCPVDICSRQCKHWRLPYVSPSGGNGNRLPYRAGPGPNAPRTFPLTRFSAR